MINHIVAYELPTHTLEDQYIRLPMFSSIDFKVDILMEAPISYAMSL